MPGALGGLSVIGLLSLFLLGCLIIRLWCRRVFFCCFGRCALLRAGFTVGSFDGLYDGNSVALIVFIFFHFFLIFYFNFYFVTVLWVTWWVDLVCLGFKFCCFSLIEFVVLGFKCGCLLV